MFVKDIKYTDFDGNEREETLYFNLTEQEALELEFGEAGGLDGFIRRVVREKDVSNLMGIFKEILLKSYGEKTDDGKYFMKNDQIRERFACTQAFSDLFIEFATDADAAAIFINNVIAFRPETKAKIEAAQKENENKTLKEV